MDTTVKYRGAALPGAAATVTLLDTVAAGWPKNAFAMYGQRRFVVDVKHSHSFTFNWYTSVDRGATWVQQGTQAVAVTANATSTHDFFVEGLADWRLQVVNGGANQTTWVVNMWLASERSPAA